MLFRERVPEETEKNTYPWPKCYYMESEPRERRRFLEERLAEDDSGEMGKIARLFDLRYETDKNGKYVDKFMRAWLDLSMLGESLNSRLARKSNQRAAERVAKMLCLDRTEEFGRDLLCDELCHLAGTYIVLCQSDSKYCSVFLGMGRMREEKIREKLRDELRFLSRTIPETLKMEDTFALFTDAVRAMEGRML